MKILSCNRCGAAVWADSPACPQCHLPGYVAPAWNASEEVAFVQQRPWYRRMTPNSWTIAFLVVSLTPCIIGGIVAAVERADRVEKEAILERARSRQEEEAAASAAAAKREAAERKQSAIDAARAKSGSLDRKERGRWLHDCVMTLDCEQSQIDAILDGAPDARERAHAERAWRAADVEKCAREHGEDGTTMAIVPAGLIAGVVSRDTMRLAMLELVPKATVAEARRKPSSVRGRAITASGTIIEMHQMAELTEGAMLTGDMKIVRFVTTSPVGELDEDSWAKFTGVFVQNYSYANVSGGETQSVLLAGAFDIAQNRLALTK